MCSLQLGMLRGDVGEHTELFHEIGAELAAATSRLLCRQFR
jgi:hypothetical protein